MIPVEKITEKEIEKRFWLLPQKLQDLSDSANTARIVGEVCRNSHITDEERVLIVKQIVGLVFLGFVHYYDVGKEINNELSLNNPALANALAEELNAKVFNPIRTELENNYQPVADEEITIKPAALAARPIEEIKKPGAEKQAAGPPDAATPSKETWPARGERFGLTSAEAPAEPTRGELAEPIDIEKIFNIKPPPPVSMGAPAFGQEQNGAGSLPGKPPSPTAPPIRKEQPTASRTETKERPLGEFEKLGLSGGPVEPPVAPARRGLGEEGSADEPKILQEEERIKPGTAAGFKLDIPTPKLSEIKKSETAPPLRPATIEYPGKPPPSPKASADAGALADKSESKARVVNYSELRTPLTDISNVKNTEAPRQVGGYGGGANSMPARPNEFGRSGGPARPNEIGRSDWRMPQTKSEEATAKPTSETPTRFVFGAKKPNLPPPPAPDKTKSMLGGWTSAGSPTSGQPAKPPPVPVNEEKTQKPTLLGDEKMMHPFDSAQGKPPAPPRQRIEPPPIPPRQK